MSMTSDVLVAHKLYEYAAYRSMWGLVVEYVRSVQFTIVSMSEIAGFFPTHTRTYTHSETRFKLPRVRAGAGQDAGEVCLGRSATRLLRDEAHVVPFVYGCLLHSRACITAVP